MKHLLPVIGIGWGILFISGQDRANVCSTNIETLLTCKSINMTPARSMALPALPRGHVHVDRAHQMWSRMRSRKRGERSEWIVLSIPWCQRVTHGYAIVRVHSSAIKLFVPTTRRKHKSGRIKPKLNSPAKIQQILFKWLSPVHTISSSWLKKPLKTILQNTGI